MKQVSVEEMVEAITEKLEDRIYGLHFAMLCLFGDIPRGRMSWNLPPGVTPSMLPDIGRYEDRYQREVAIPHRKANEQYARAVVDLFLHAGYCMDEIYAELTKENCPADVNLKLRDHI